MTSTTTRSNVLSPTWSMRYCAFCNRNSISYSASIYLDFILLILQRSVFVRTGNEVSIVCFAGTIMLPTPYQHILCYTHQWQSCISSKFCLFPEQNKRLHIANTQKSCRQQNGRFPTSINRSLAAPVTSAQRKPGSHGYHPQCSLRTS